MGNKKNNIKNSVIVILSFFLVSCISESEKQAIQELSVYGGQVSISNGVHASTDGGNRKFKKILVEGSGVVDEGIIDPEILASKFTITVFNKLDNKERGFDEIVVELNKADGSIFSYKISKRDLDKIESELKFVNKWILELRNNKIDESYKYLKAPSIQLPEIEPYRNKFLQLKEKFGPIESVWFDGYVHESVSDTIFHGEVHQFIYDIRAKNGVYAIHFLMNPEEKNYKIYGMSFDE